jgi:hypothetical protein
MKKEIAIISLLAILVLIGIGNLVQITRAQTPGPVTSGFWFMRRPPVPAHIKGGAEVALVMEINRLTLLSTIPLDDPHITDYIGNPIIWDQDQLDAVNAEITRLQLLLNDF